MRGSGVGLAAHADPAGGGIDHAVRAIAPAFQGRYQGQGLHGRTRLVNVGHGPVAHGRRRFGLAAVGVVARVVDHRQNFPGAGIERDYRAGTGAALGDRALQLPVLQELQAQVDTEREVATRQGRLQYADIAHHLTVQVLDVFFLAGRAPQPIVVSQLQARDPRTVHVGDAHQLGGDLTRRIKPPVLPLAIDSLEAAGKYFACLAGNQGGGAGT